MSDYVPFPVQPSPGGGPGGVTSHGALTGRNNASQHNGDAVDVALADVFEGTLNEFVGAVLVGNANKVWVVDSTVGFDLTGIIDPTTDSLPVPAGWRMAIFNQVDPTWDGIWEGNADPDPAPLTRIADLPASGVIVCEFLATTAEALMAPISGGHIIAKPPDWGESSFTGLNGYFGMDTNGGGWVVVHSNYYIDSATTNALEAGRGVWPDYNENGDATLDADNVGGRVVLLASTAVAPATFTIPVLTTYTHFRVHNPSDYNIILAPDTGVTFNVHGGAATEVVVLPGGWAQVWTENGNITITGDGFAYVWDAVGEAYVPTFGCRTFIGPNDPASEGFTLADGDQWKDTTP